MAARLWTAFYGNAYLLGGLASLAWAGNTVLGRGIADHVPPMTLAWMRWTGAFLILLPFAWTHISRDWPVIRGHPWLMFFFGLTGTATFNTLAYVALTYTTANTVALLNSACPVGIVVACLVLFGDRITVRQWAGVLLSLVGVLTTITQGEPARLAVLGQSVGEVLMLIAVIVWAIYAACFRLRPNMHPLSFAAATFAIASLINLPLVGVEMALGKYPKPTLETGLALLYVAIFPSLIGYMFVNRSIELIGPSRSGALMHLLPLFAAVLSIVFLGEPPRLYHVIGFALIIAGVVLASHAPVAATAKPVEKSTSA